MRQTEAHEAKPRQEAAACAPGDAASQNVTAISGGNGQEPDKDASKLPATSEDCLA
jgi:hypothetical protein